MCSRGERARLGYRSSGHAAFAQQFRRAALQASQVGRSSGAVPTCSRGERESMLGVDDLDTLTSMYNLAALLKKKGDLSSAESFARRSLKG